MTLESRPVAVPPEMSESEHKKQKQNMFGLLINNLSKNKEMVQ